MIRLSATALGLAAALLAGAATAQEATPDITGEWTGTYLGGVRGGGGQLHPAYNPPQLVEAGDITFTLIVGEQNSRGFTGTFGTDFGTQTLQGVIRLDNESLLMLDDDSSLVGTLLSDNEMEFCGHSLNLSERLTTCLLLTPEELTWREWRYGRGKRSSEMTGSRHRVRN